jgi:nucleoid-associated protein YgaU
MVIGAIAVDYGSRPPKAPPLPAATQAGPTPAPPAGAHPAEKAPERRKAPTFDVVRVNPRGDAVIAGRAPPGTKVTITKDGLPIGEVTADDGGEWVFLPDPPLAPGPHQIGLEGEGEEGARVQSEDVIVLVISEPGKDIGGRPAAGSAQALAMKVPRSGVGPTTVLQMPRSPETGEAPPSASVSAAPGQPPAGEAPPGEAKGPAAPVVEPGAATGTGTLAIEAVDYDAEGRVAISGRASPGARVNVYLGDRFLGQAIADATGLWRLRPDGHVPSGLQALRADQLDADGAVRARREIPFSRSELPAGEPDDRMVVVQPGNSLWRIARRVYGSGFAYTTIYEANRSQIRDPDLIYPGQVFALPSEG